MVDLPDRLAEFAFPGELRERLVRAILDGAKTATAGLLLEYELEAEPLPEPGSRSTVVDSAGRPVAVIETVAVEIVPFAAVDLAFARDEGEGFETVDDWRIAHRRFWESDEVRASIGRSDFAVEDDTPVVTERFRLVEVIRSPSAS
jgi:uncharacterized protein YhfF